MASDVNSYQQMQERLQLYLDSILNASAENLYTFNLWTFLEMGFQIFVGDTSFLLNCVGMCLERIEKHFGGRNNLPYVRIAAIKQKLMVSHLMYEMNWS